MSKKDEPKKEEEGLLKKEKVEAGQHEVEGKKPLLDAAENDFHKEAVDKLNKTDEEAQKKALEAPMTKKLFFAVFVCAMGSSFQFGYNIGVVNAPQSVVEEWQNDSHYNIHGEHMHQHKGLLIWSITVSVFAVGGMIGGLLCGFLADRFGRKGALLMNNIFAFIAAALMGFSKISHAYPLLIVGRFVIGFNCGLNSGLAPMYLTEVSPVNLRGAIGSVNQLVVTISILVSQIFGLSFLLGNAEWWPLLFALTALPAVFQVIALPFCPETPKYSLILKHQDEQAEKDLKSLRNKEDVSAEMEAMREEASRMKKVPKVKFSDMFTQADLRWPLFIAVMMMFSQQFSGINAAMFYSTSIFKKAGLTQEGATYATLGMGAINVFMTIISVVLVDRAGRRTLHLTGLAGMWATSILLVAMLVVLNNGNSWASYLCVVLVLLFVVSFATGPGSIPWFYVSELFGLGARGHANSVAVMTNWMATFIVALIFPPLQHTAQEYSFLLFTCCLTIFWIFTFKFVPETKGTTVEEIVERMKKQKVVR